MKYASLLILLHVMLQIVKNVEIHDDINNEILMASGVQNT